MTSTNDFSQWDRKLVAENILSCRFRIYDLNTEKFILARLPHPVVIDFYGTTSVTRRVGAVCTRGRDAENFQIRVVIKENGNSKSIWINLTNILASNIEIFERVYDHVTYLKGKSIRGLFDDCLIFIENDSTSKMIKLFSQSISTPKRMTKSISLSIPIKVKRPTMTMAIPSPTMKLESMMMSKENSVQCKRVSFNLTMNEEFIVPLRCPSRKRKRRRF